MQLFPQAPLRYHVCRRLPEAMGGVGGELERAGVELSCQRRRRNECEIARFLTIPIGARNGGRDGEDEWMEWSSHTRWRRLTVRA